MAIVNNNAKRPVDMVKFDGTETEFKGSLDEFVEECIIPDDLRKLYKTFNEDPDNERRGFGGPSYGVVTGGVYLIPDPEGDILYQEADNIFVRIGELDDPLDIIESHFRHYHDGRSPEEQDDYDHIMNKD